RCARARDDGVGSPAGGGAGARALGRDEAHGRVAAFRLGALHDEVVRRVRGEKGEDEVRDRGMPSSHHHLPVLAASSATYARASSSNHGGSPAAAFSSACRTLLVAGIAQCTRGSLTTYLSSACAQVRTP